MVRAPTPCMRPGSLKITEVQFLLGLLFGFYFAVSKSSMVKPIEVLPYFPFKLVLFQSINDIRSFFHKRANIVFLKKCLFVHSS
jgi:hypothetical protein